MALASEILARAFENRTGALPRIDNITLVNKFLDIDNEIGLLALLRSINAVELTQNWKHYLILAISSGSKLEIKSFRDSREALNSLFVMEQQQPGINAVLVSAGSNADVREAFRNYFSDASEFIQLVIDGCKILATNRERI